MSIGLTNLFAHIDEENERKLDLTIKLYNQLSPESKALTLQYIGYTKEYNEKSLRAYLDDLELMHDILDTLIGGMQREILLTPPDAVPIKDNKGDYLSTLTTLTLYNDIVNDIELDEIDKFIQLYHLAAEELQDSFLEETFWHGTVSDESLKEHVRNLSVSGTLERHYKHLAFQITNLQENVSYQVLAH